MAKHNTKAILINLDPELLDKIETYRHKRMFPTRAEAIYTLLLAGLRANPERKPKAKAMSQ